MKISSNKKIILFFSSLLLAFFVTKTASAVWNGTFYNPGDTLNPECAPTDVDCDVIVPFSSQASLFNYFFGKEAGNVMSGANNTALGFRAGKFITDGSTPNLTSGSSLYLGSNTKALADGDTNEIVIGYNTTGLGSNSVVLGNSVIATTVLRGDVGIGTTTPGTILHTSAVNPIITMTDTATNVTGNIAQIGSISTWGVNRNPATSAAISAARPTASITMNTNSGDSYIYFSTSPTNNVDGIERMRIDKDGNVGVGDITPASLFTVGDSDLFQINSTGQIGAQTAPLSDYILSLAGTANNDNSRVIDITQANNNAAEDAFGIYLTVDGSSNLNRGIYADASGSANSNTGGLFFTHGTSGTNMGIQGTAAEATTSKGGVFSASGTSTSLGIQSTASGASSTNRGVFASAIGAAEDNYGLLVTSTGATNNYGLYIDDVSGGTNNYAIYTAFATPSYFGGNVGIKDTTPTEAVLVVGNAGAGDIYGTFATSANTETLCWDASGASLITDCTSLSRFKENVTVLSLPGIETVMQLTPREYDWIGKEDGIKHDLGFVAEEVNAVSPLLASYSIRETGLELNGVKYERMSALFVKAIQELNLKLENLFTKFTIWLGDAGNGIGEIFAQTFRAADKLCINDTCVTEAQLQTLLENSGMTSSSEPATTPEPESITISEETITTPPDEPAPLLPQGGEEISSPPSEATPEDEQGGVPEGGGGAVEPTPEPALEPVI